MMRWAPLCWILAACAPLPPIGRDPAYSSGLRQIENTPVEAATGPLWAGWAAAPIDVPADLPLAGYGDRNGAPHWGSIDPPHLRALALRVNNVEAMVVIADLLLISSGLAEAVRARLAELPPEAIFFSASHTHSGPGGYVPGLLWQLAMGPYDASFFEALVEQVVTVARAARAKLAPAGWQQGRCHLPGWAQNRVERGGLTHDWATWLTITKNEAQALFWSWTVHPTTLDSSNLRLSADYPGQVAAALPHYDWVAFGAGAVGSTAPNSVAKNWTQVAQSLDRCVLRFSKQNARLARASAWVASPRYRWVLGAGLMLWPGWVEFLVDEPRLNFGVLALDDHVLAFVPGEPSGDWGRALAASARQRGQSIMPLAFAGSYAGYLVAPRVHALKPDRQGPLFRYETRSVGFLGPAGGGWFLQLVDRLAARATAPPSGDPGSNRPGTAR